jgi:hypothetical protein
LFFQKAENQEKDEIDKSTLMTLLLYVKLDQEEPEFFLALKKMLDKKNSSVITKDDFLKIFWDGELSYQNIKIDEMTSVYM